MGIVSVRKGGALYWLGRYAQRVIVLSTESYKIIDPGIGVGRETTGLAAVHRFCEHFGIADRFTTTEEFMQRWFLDRRKEYSMIVSLQRAYDNALVLRDLLPLESFASFREGHSLLDSLSRPDFLHVQEVIHDLYAFWGSFEDSGEEIEFALAQFGRYIERIDLCLRLEQPLAEQFPLWRRLARLGSILDVEIPVTEIPTDRTSALRCVNSLFQEVFPDGA